MKLSLNEMKYYQEPDQVLLSGNFPGNEIQTLIQQASKVGDQIYWD